MPGASKYSLDILEEDAHSPATASILELGGHLSLVILGRNSHSLLTSMPLNKMAFSSASIQSHWPPAVTDVALPHHHHHPTTTPAKSSEPPALSWAPAAPCIPPQRKIALERHQVALGGMEGSRLRTAAEERRAATPTPKLRFGPSLLFLFSLESLCAFEDSLLTNLGPQRCGEAELIWESPPVCLDLVY